jgi:hypothetical protein
VFLFLIFPSLLLMRVFAQRELDPANVFFGIVSAIWYLIALHSLTTKPLINRWRLARTQYALSTRRAFVIEPWRGGRRIRFVFVDSLPARFDRTMHPGGSGDVTVGQGIVFTQIADASAVHQELVNAVLTARRDLPDLGWQDSPVAGMNQ